MLHEQPHNTRSHVVIALLAAFIVYNVIWLGFPIAFSVLSTGGPTRVMSSAQNRQSLISLCEIFVPLSIVISIIQLGVNALIKTFPSQRRSPMWLTMALAGIVMCVLGTCLEIISYLLMGPKPNMARLGINTHTFWLVTELFLLLPPCTAGAVSGFTYQAMINRPIFKDN